MSPKKAPLHSLISALLGILLASSAIADKAVTNAEVHSASNFQLKGILISGSKRSILVDDILAREGDHVAGADIISIGERGVRIRVGSRERTVGVGFSGEWEESLSARTITESDPETQFVSVKRGDTLSHIAERQLRGAVTRHQMIIALYEANPQAFSGNINLLREGAVLRIPDDASLLQQSPETAVAEVVRQTKAWRTQYERQNLLAETSNASERHVVAQDNTPATVSARISSHDIKTNEMKHAKLNATAQANSFSVDVPQEGVVQFVTNVVREISAWWHDAGRPIPVVNAVGHLNATSDSLLAQGNSMLLLTSHE